MEAAVNFSVLMSIVDLSLILLQYLEGGGGLRRGLYFIYFFSASVFVC